MRPFASSDAAGSMSGTAAWESVRQVMLNIISVGEYLDFMVRLGGNPDSTLDGRSTRIMIGSEGYGLK